MSGKIKHPPIKYYGSKWRLAEWIIPNFPPHKTYVEPFGGSASVLLQKQPSRNEVYNDLSDEIVNLFQVLRDPDKTQRLIDLLMLTPYSRKEWQLCAEFSDDQMEQARRTVFYYCASFNAAKAGSRRRNAFRNFTRGYHRYPQDFQKRFMSFPDITERLRNVVIENRDALALISDCDAVDTLFYIDPPYIRETRSEKGNHYNHEMDSVEEHKELAEVLNNLNGMVILSGYDHKCYKELYEDRGWKKMNKLARTSAAKTGSSTKTESIWINPAAQEKAINKSLF